MIDVNKRIADIRKVADDKYAVSKDIGKEAAILYARIEKIHAAKAVLEIVKENLAKYAAATEEVSNAIVDESFEEYTALL